MNTPLEQEFDKSIEDVVVEVPDEESPEIEERERPFKEELEGIREIRFWQMYLNPKSKTYSNGYRSALRAGYTDAYAKMITTKPFFIRKMRRINMLGKAEKVIDKTLDMETKDQNGREQADLLRIQVDAAKHITKTLGKDEGYAERSEVTGRGGEEIRISEIVFNAPTIGVKEDKQNGESKGNNTQD